jgi:hypothetical protein
VSGVGGVGVDGHVAYGEHGAAVRKSSGLCSATRKRAKPGRDNQSQSGGTLMRYVKTLGLMLLAVLAISAVTAGSAFAVNAELLNLPEGTTSELSDVGTATFEATGGGLTVKCPTLDRLATLQTPSHATFDALFLGCNVGGFKCTGSKDTTAGSILVLGTILFRAIKLGGVLKAVAINTIEEVEFTCLGVVTKVRGTVVGLIKNAAGSKSKKLETLLKGEKGKQEITEVEGVSLHLESSTGGGAFVESDQAQEAIATSTPEGEIMY